MLTQSRSLFETLAVTCRPAASQPCCNPLFECEVENFDRSSKPLRQPAASSSIDLMRGSCQFAMLELYSQVARLPSHSSDSDSSAEVQRAIDEVQLDKHFRFLTVLTIAV